MARAVGVWIVRGSYPDPDLFYGVFTVKHECAAWLGKQRNPWAYLIHRCVDGNLKYEGTKWEQPIVKVPIDEFAAMPEFKQAWDTTHDYPFKGANVLTSQIR